MHYVLLTLNGLLMIAMPLVLGLFISRRGKVGWGLFGIGAVTFVGSQVLHIPFNWLVESSGVLPANRAAPGSLLLVALFYGLSAGVFEEGARFIVFRYWARRARTWWQGLMVGAGHGGIEAILLGLLFAVNMGFLIGVQSGRFTELVPAEDLPALQEQITQLFSAPWYYMLLGALERLFAITAHLALSLLVLLSVVRGRLRWLGAAVLWHTLLNAVAVFGLQQWGPYVVEAAIGVVALLSLGIILALRDRFPESAHGADVQEAEDTPLPESPAKVDATPQQLDESRFQ